MGTQIAWGIIVILSGGGIWWLLNDKPGSKSDDSAHLLEQCLLRQCDLEVRIACSVINGGINYVAFKLLYISKESALASRSVSSDAQI